MNVEDIRVGDVLDCLGERVWVIAIEPHEWGPNQGLSSILWHTALVDFLDCPSTSAWRLMADPNALRRESRRLGDLSRSTENVTEDAA